MRFGSGQPLAYPLVVTIGALVICLASAPFADPDQLAGLAAVGLGIIGYTGFQLGIAFGYLPTGFDAAGGSLGVEIERVRQQHRLVSRSWLEITTTDRTLWLPVYFAPELLTMTAATAQLTGRTLHSAESRLHPSGRARTIEPAGRLIDNPSRPDPDGPVLATESTRLTRRLLLDAQSAAAAPFAALMWIYVAGGGLPTFLATTCVTAATATWLSAIRGSDPS